MNTAPPPPPQDKRKKKQATPAAPLPTKIVLVTHYYPAHGGGIEKVAGHLASDIATDRDLILTWSASDCDPAPQTEGTTYLPMRTCNATEKLLGFPWPIWGPRSVMKLRKAITEADGVWLHDTLYLGNIFAFLIAKARRKPVAITQHIEPIPYKNPVLRLLMRVADKVITGPMLRHANETIFISDRVAEDYYHKVSFIRPIKVIPNGVDLRLFHPAMPENRRFLRQQFAVKNEQPILLFVGRFVEKKGMDVLRRLAVLLPEWRFWLAGAGPIDPAAWLLPNVHVLKGRQGQSLAELYQAADLLILPSYGEGFPLVIQEAMACGLPVLCSPETAKGNMQAARYLHTAEVWPCNPERTAAVWYEKIKAMPLALPLEGPEEGLAELAQQTWDWHPIAQVYADILKKMTTKKGAARAK
ncbi:MAG: glycosyltransferase family 4 protein [Alphaproteobacteria bacterium]|nr:glycosyltransferase family 4 protein [Alphaproteobacteria bacterium]